MSLIVTEIQPQGASRIGWRNPLTRGLTGLFHAPAGLRELVSGTLFARAGAVVTFGPSTRGISAQFGTSASNLQFNCPLAAPVANTMFAMVKPGSLVVTTRGISLLSSAGNYSAQLAQSGNAGWLGQIYPSATATTVTDATAVVLNRPEILCQTWDGTTLTLYRNGRLVGTPTAVAGPARAVAAWYLGEASFLGDLDLAAYWQNRCLSVGEVADLSANPWQLLEPAPRRIFPSTTYGVLTGRAAGISAGTLARTSSRALTGRAVTATPGALAKGTTRFLTGRAGAFSAGTMTGPYLTGPGVYFWSLMRQSVIQSSSSAKTPIFLTSEFLP